jgi:hypothetical protein
MAERSPDEKATAQQADAVNTRLLELLEQVVANQSVQATANLFDQITERQLAAQLGARDSYGRGGQAPPALGAQQQQVALRFGALRNALGDFGRHGDRDVALLTPAPRLHPDGTLEFLAPLPAAAATLTLFRADGTVLGTVTDIGGTTPVLDTADATAWVQVDDAHNTPILLGFPLRDPASTSVY